MFAIDDLSDAIDVTRRFLTPVTLGAWLRLALIVFFVGGVGFGNPSFSGGGFGGEPSPGMEPDPGAIDLGEWLPLLIGLAIVVLGVGLVFAFLGSLFEFTLLESLRSGEVHVRRYTKRNVGRGLHLFGFRVALGLLALVVIGVPLLAVFLSTSGSVSPALIGLFVLLAIPVSLTYAVISRFTTVFVAPTMLQEDVGVIAAWKRFWATLTGNWTEYLAYLLLVWVVQLLISFAMAIVLLVLLIPFVIVFFIFLFIPFLNLLVFALGIPLFVLVSLLVQVPVVAYLRYYALLVLGDTDADLDLIPEQRAAIRGGGPVGDSGPDGRWDASDDRTDDEFRGWDDTDESDSGDDTDETGSWDDTDESRSWDDPDSGDETDAWDDSSESDDSDEDDRDDDDDYGWR